MASKQSQVAELISLMFVIGRFMREEGHKKTGKGPFCSLLQFETLRYVHDHEKPLMRDVAHYFRITPPAATLLIDGLVRENLLSRVFDRKDRRAVRVGLTRGGRELLAKGIKVKINRLKRIFSALTPAEKVQLVGLLKKMAKSTGQVA